MPPTNRDRSHEPSPSAQLEESAQAPIAVDDLGSHELSPSAQLEKKFLETLLKEHQARSLRGDLPVAKDKMPMPQEGPGSSEEDGGDLPVAKDKMPMQNEAYAYEQAFAPNITVIPLRNEQEWTDFSESMTVGSEAANWKPWRRIVGILRHHEAAVCVVEHDYICLDYRSEMASFYSQLNASAPRRSARLHFFKKPVDKDQVFNLNKDQRESYLGYVVIRPGDLPLVGRTNILYPGYIDVPASIEEVVNFFGQHLTVEGVPFMQQDERFDTCAHVIAWSAHYSAYRRGLVGRRLIADFVAPQGLRPMSPQGFQSMSPVPATGLFSQDIVEMFSNLGLRAIFWSGAGADPDPRWRTLEPDVQKHWEDAVTEFYPEEVKKGTPKENDRFGTFIDRLTCFSTFTSPEDPLTVENRGNELGDDLIYSIARPYIESRWPIYCSTRNHAMLLCGLSKRGSQHFFFFHDDQNGPYLISKTARTASSETLKRQAPRDSVQDEATVIINEDGQPNGVSDRGVEGMVIPLPSRLLLDPLEAVATATDKISRIGGKIDATGVFILMGTDYRQSRRNEVQNSSNSAAVELFSSMALSEWVILVEGYEEGTVKWEFVFDGSSGQRAPVIQFARFGESCFYSPGIGAKSQVLTLPDLAIRGFNPELEPRVRVPSRIGKSQESDKIK